jgi:transcriptional regulator with XRE-family HTH domain
MDYNESERILACVMAKLENERKRQGLSLRKFAALSGIERTTIGKVEKGQRAPSLPLCLRLADALGLELADVLKSVTAKKRRRKSSAYDAPAIADIPRRRRPA